jgi:hypothetical protein
MLPAGADAPTRRLAACLRRLATAPDEKARERLRHHPQCREYLAPIVIHADCELACQVEALILARLKPQDIGARIGVAPRAIALYGTLYFDVSRRIDEGAYIHRRAIGCEWERGAAVTMRRRVAMKYFAYHSGPLALEQLFGIVPATWTSSRGSQKWQSPVRVVADMLSSEHLIDELGELLRPQLASVQEQRRQKVLEELRRRCSEVYPQHPLEYAVWSDTPHNPFTSPEANTP